MNPQAGLPYVAEGALTRGMAVMIGTARNQVKVTTGANVAIVGFAINDAADGQEVAIFPVNGAGKCKAIAGASFSRGDKLVVEGSDGRLKLLPASGATLKEQVAIADEDGDDGQLVDVLPGSAPHFTALT
jgi:hypothetical protein